MIIMIIIIIIIIIYILGREGGAEIAALISKLMQLKEKRNNLVSFFLYCLENICSNMSRLRLLHKEDITRWREDMNFMFEWQEQYLMSERSKRVRYCSCHKNIKFISELTSNVLCII